MTLGGKVFSDFMPMLLHSKIQLNKLKCEWCRNTAESRCSNQAKAAAGGDGMQLLQSSQGHDEDIRSSLVHPQLQ